MKICSEHWTELRKALADRGIERLVSQSTEELQERLRNPIPANFDPLFAANLAITTQFVENAGIAAMHFNGCPVCEAIKHDAPDWIDGVADEMRDYAKEHGLLAKEN